MPVDAGLEAVLAQCELGAQMSMCAGNSAGMLFEHIELNMWGFKFPATFAFCVKEHGLATFFIASKDYIF